MSDTWSALKTPPPASRNCYNCASGNMAMAVQAKGNSYDSLIRECLETHRYWEWEETGKSKK